MKKFLLTTMMVTAFLFNTETKAQFRVNLNVNIGGRPGWGIPGNYAGNYYYLPEIDCYYDIHQRQFIYFDGGRWLFASELPYQFRDYDLFRGFKVAINESKPYLHHQVYQERYSRYYNTYKRPLIYAQAHDGYKDNRFNNDRNNGQFNREKENQHFDNKRKEDDHNNRNDHDNHEKGHGRG